MQILIRKRIPIDILILAVAFSLVETKCPSVCNCSEEAVLCINKNIEKIPNFDPLENSPLVIDLSGNKIAMIGPDELSFEKSYMVKEVYLNNSELIDIDNEAFDDMENLQELYLGENLLTVIPEDFIEDLTNMVLLDLSENPFEGNMPIIRSDSLEVLVLANCQITDITADALKYLPNLRLLLLPENNIHYINPEVFEFVSEWFFVRLSYNTWECNCKTLEVFSYLAEKKYIDLSEPYQCSTTNLTFVNIYDFQKSEKYKKMCNANSTEVIEEHDKKQGIDKRNLLINTESTTSIENDTNKNASDKITERNDNTISKENSSREGGFSVSLIIFVISVISFVLGIFFGIVLNQLVRVPNHLENSDSTSKLIH